MKQLILVLLMSGFVFAANAQVPTQQESKKEKSKKEQPQLKEHKCADACMKAGKCVFVHGEKGHQCTAECKKTENVTKELKGHVCTAACKEGKHRYAHGEKGHVCGDACKNKM